MRRPILFHPHISVIFVVWCLFHSRNRLCSRRGQLILKTPCSIFPEANCENLSSISVQTNLLCAVGLFHFRGEKREGAIVEFHASVHAPRRLTHCLPYSLLFAVLLPAIMAHCAPPRECVLCTCARSPPTYTHSNTYIHSLLQSTRPYAEYD
jgi:hypothetical protein